MKGRYVVLLSFLLFSLGSYAQVDLPVLMTEVSKGIKVAANAQAKWSKVKTPKVVSSDSRMTLNKTASVTMYCNGIFKTLEGQGEYNLSDVFRDQIQATTTEWQKEFNTFLSAAGNSERSFGKKLPEDNGQIKAISPMAGKLATFKIQFYWQADEEITDLQLEITNADGKVMYTAEASGGVALADPRKARLLPGRDYNWRVFSSSQPELTSDNKTFQMNTLGQKSQVLPGLKEDKSYQDTSPFIQSLMEAAWFESKEWYFDADQSFRKLLKNMPDNPLSMQFYQAFLNRCGAGE